MLDGCFGVTCGNGGFDENSISDGHGGIEMSAQPKLCRDCRLCIPVSRWHLLGWGIARWRYAKCGHVTAMAHPEFDLVTGETTPAFRNYASVMRDSPAKGRCGKDAIYFEERP